MRNVRIFYKKKGRMKFVSHLDMNRFMSRLLTKAHIPVWYTEGFNQHIYMNFAVPLSLGFEGDYEILDIRITDPDFSDDDCLNALKEAAIEDIVFIKVASPWANMKEIAYAEYVLEFDTIPAGIETFLSRESIICLKKGKKGKLKEIDLIPKIKAFEIDGSRLKLVLNSGCEDNLNPTLVMDTFFEQINENKSYYTVTRTAVLDKAGNLFE